MSSTKRAVTAAGIVAVIAAVVVGWASLASGDPKNTLVLEGKQTSFTPVELPPDGDSPGDEAVLAGTLSKDGKSSGTYQGYCVLIAPPDTTQCTYSFALEDGQIIVSTGYGAFNGGEHGNPRNPIVGGSGSYSKARGWVEEAESGDGTFTETFHFES